MLLNLEGYLNKNLLHAEEEIELIPLIRQPRIEEQCIFKRQFKRQVKRFAKAKKGYCNSMIKKWAKTVIKYQFEVGSWFLLFQLGIRVLNTYAFRLLHTFLI